MSVRPFLALAAVTALITPLAPAAAADYAGPPVFSLCAPPPADIAQPAEILTYKDFRGHKVPPRIMDVQRYDPHHPPAAAVPTYVIPQTAFLASPLCDFPDGVSQRSWYDGKLWYKPNGVRASPDTFMKIERK
jgi:hypothetical protein